MFFSYEILQPFTYLNAKYSHFSHATAMRYHLSNIILFYSLVHLTTVITGEPLLPLSSRSFDFKPVAWWGASLCWYICYRKWWGVTVHSLSSTYLFSSVFFLSYHYCIMSSNNSSEWTAEFYMMLNCCWCSCIIWPADFTHEVQFTCNGDHYSVPENSCIKSGGLWRQRFKVWKNNPVSDVIMVISAWVWDNTFIQ